MRVLIAIAALSLPALAIAGDATVCSSSIAQAEYGRIVDACLDLPNDDQSAKLEALASGTFKHHLGTIERPSKAFAMMRARADDGDARAQYTFGLLYAMVHVHPQQSELGRTAQNLDQYNSEVRATAAQYTRMAADQGHSLAMLDLAEYYVRLSYQEERVDLDEALAYAQRAESNGNPIAYITIDKVKRRIRELR